MKLYCKLLMLALLSIFIVGAYSCGDDDITEPTPTPVPVPDKVTLNAQSLTVESTEASASLTITSNKAWTASSNQSWCTLSQVSGEAGSITITLAFSANSTEEDRTATITVKAGTATATATVKQEKKEVEAKIELDITSFDVGPDAGTVNLKMTTNKNWIAASDQEWCKLSATEGEACSIDLTISYDANPDETERIAVFTIKADTATATVTVKQEEKDIIEMDNNSFTVNPEAGLVKLKITTNKDWKASLNQSWCTLSATKGKGGAADLIITYEANPFSSERTATLAIKVGTATSSVILKQIKNENGKNGIESGGIQGLPNHKW